MRWQFRTYPWKGGFSVFLLNNGLHYDMMVVFVCLHIALPHYDLSKGVELLKCLSGAFVSSVCHHQIGSMTHLPLFRVRS